MPKFDNLPPAEFAGFRFPVSSVSVRGSLRHHVHEYPHSPGGAVEVLGRKLYEIGMKVPFLDKMKGYPKLWPETLASLRIIFEGGRTFDLTVPTIGVIQAKCIEWPEEADMKRARSGVFVELKFLEDATNQFLVESLIGASSANVASAEANMQAEIDLLKVQLGDLGAEIDSLMGAGGDLMAIKDQVELYGNVIDAKLQGVIALCQDVVDTADIFQDPSNHAALSAIKDFWFACVKLGEDIKSKVRKIVDYTVPREMAVSDVARILYGGTSDSVLILQMNELENAFAIPAGKKLRVYEALAV